MQTSWSYVVSRNVRSSGLRASVGAQGRVGFLFVVLMVIPISGLTCYGK